jgi:uncharacterized membrane protein YhaH (DUF805 family)
MDALTLFTSTDGRLSRGGFWLCLLAIYAAGIAAQALLAPEAIARTGVWAFVAVQAALLWAWLCIHIKRLRDAGKGGAGAIAVAAVYGLSVLLVVVLIAFLTNPNVVGTPAQGAPAPADTAGNTAGSAPASTWLAFLLVFVIFGMLFSRDFGAFMIILKLIIFIASLPMIISLGFSLITGLRKTLPV